MATTFETRTGDLLADDADVLVNPVNCKGVMGAGLARQFADRYPEMYVDYRDDCERGFLSPGVLHLWQGGDSPIIVNLPTKIDWRDKSAFADVALGLRALRHTLAELVEDDDVKSIAVPALGCGLGGLDWDKVEPMIRGMLDGVVDHVRLYPPREN